MQLPVSLSTRQLAWDFMISSLQRWLVPTRSTMIITPEKIRQVQAETANRDAQEEPERRSVGPDRCSQCLFYRNYSISISIAKPLTLSATTASRFTLLYSARIGSTAELARAPHTSPERDDHATVENSSSFNESRISLMLWAMYQPESSSNSSGGFVAL